MKNQFDGLLQSIITETVPIDDAVARHQKEFQDYASRVIMGYVKPNDPNLETFLRVCLDVYTHSPTGQVMIPDSIYDQCMQIYKSGGNETIVFADALGKKWKFIDHEIPGVVGTIDKVYSYKEFKGYLSRYHGVEYFTLSPKFDGISAAIKVVNGEIVSAATRYDGIHGQDITELIKRSRNGKNFIDPENQNGFYKCELCVGTDAFNELSEIRKYSNRRSATSGIINTPSNLNLAQFVTVIPLAFYDPKKKKLEYIAPCQRRVSFYSPADLFEEVENLLKFIRKKDFQFRIDGVVINPDRDLLGNPNELDLMDTSIAYKVNTAEGRTKIKYGYMSVGRTGRAMPMLKVEPVEVNETIVEDVSLGSYDKFLSMDLKEGEEVIVYSAGDVIPQIKLPDDRYNFENLEELKIDKHCPYCGEKLERNYTEYACRNPNCIRVITGRISNFLDKLGMQGFSDRSIEMIYEGLHIDSILGFLNLTSEELQKVEGFSNVSADNLVDELRKLRSTPTSLSKFFGALGIEGISEKKCRKIMESISLKELMGPVEKLDKIYFNLVGAPGIGEKTALTFIDFIKEHQSEIKDLIPLFKLGGDIKFKGNIAFTGFRPDSETRDRINRLGYEVNESGVSGETICLFSASVEKESSKSKAAYKRGIPVYPAHQIDNVLTELEERIIE